MRASLLSTLGAALLLSANASAVTMDWTPIGNPGNACDPQFPSLCFGDVGYTYSIGTYEVTNAQYAEFLNAKAAAGDPLGLYEPSMGFGSFGGITVSGNPGSFTFSAVPGRADMPVNLVSFYDALRFANWMNNGQGNADTETGAYTITAQGIADNSITRNAGATIFLPSEDEWYKAAYYNAATTSYFDYPAGTNTRTVCAAPGATPNTGNCDNVAAGDLTDVGSYTGSASPYGTFDQGGNVWEWNEAIFPTTSHPEITGRGLRGGVWVYSSDLFAASVRISDGPSINNFLDGFRVAMIPEPGTGLLMSIGLLGLAGWRRSHYRNDRTSRAV